MGSNPELHRVFKDEELVFAAECPELNRVLPIQGPCRSYAGVIQRALTLRHIRGKKGFGFGAKMGSQKKLHLSEASAP